MAKRRLQELWTTRTFRKRETMLKWLEKRKGRIQYEEIAVNNAWGVLWRSLRPRYG